MPAGADENIAFPDVVNNATVRHPQFGAGKVMLRTGSTEKNAKAIIKFREEGEKKLALRFAKLSVDKPVEEADASAGEKSGDE